MLREWLNPRTQENQSGLREEDFLGVVVKFLLKRSIPRGGSAEGDNAWVWDSLIWLFLYYCLT